MKPVKTAGTAAAVCSLAGVGLLPRLLDWGIDATHSAAMLLLAGLLWAAGKAVFSEKDRRLLRFSLAFGLIFAFCQLLGARLDSAGTVQSGGLLLLAASLACAPAAGGLFLLLAKGTAGTATASKEDASTPGRTFWMTFAALLVCWLPYYLAYFPGMFNYDSAGGAAQFTTGQYNGAFPPLHTLLLAAFYRLGGAVGSYNAGIALYTAVQACATAAALAYANVLLCRRGVKRGFRIGLTAAYGLLPGFPLLVTSTTKDLFFCAALLPLLCLLAEGGREPERLKKRGYAAAVVLLTALSCLLRPNGAAAIGMALIFGWFWMPREGRRRFAALLLCGLLLFAGANQGMKAALHPSKTGLRELLSVPLAQVSRVYVRHQETLTEPEKEEILSLIPDAERYQPHLADGIKRHTAVGVSTLPRFLRLYGRLLRQYPAEFADAWAFLTKGYWHLDDTTHLDIYAERGGHGYMETAAQPGYGVGRASLWPGLMEEMDRLFVENEYRRIPILSALIEPAFWCWLFFGTLWLAVFRRNREALLFALPLAGIYLTLLFGACAYLRYALPLALGALPLTGLLQNPPENGKGTNE